MTSVLLDHLEVALGGDLKCPRGGLSVASEASLTSCRSHAKSFMATQQQHKQYSTDLTSPLPRPRNAPAQQYKYHISSSFTV